MSNLQVRSTNEPRSTRFISLPIFKGPRRLANDLGFVLLFFVMSDQISLIPLVGIPGEAKNRLDILDFVKHEKFFTLYVRALRQYSNCITAA